MRHLGTSAAQPCFGGWFVMGLTGLIGILGVIMLDGPLITEIFVVVVSLGALAFSAWRLRARHSATERYRRYHRPLAGPRPGARLG